EYFIKGGADSPENFLGYFQFDGTVNQEGSYDPPTADGLHHYGLNPNNDDPNDCSGHCGDWQNGDPTWKNGKGKGIIGALNYLSGKGMNNVYFLTYNIDGGDGEDTYPWTSAYSPRDRDRYDISKLDQWEIVFSHMDKMGIQMHVVTQESENDQVLDGNNLGTIRMLYYRELIARFGHHLAIVWNLGEESDNGAPALRQFANYIRSVDPYDHMIVVHKDTYYSELLNDPNFGNGPNPNFDGTSLYNNSGNSKTIEWIDASRNAGRPWVVNVDEITPVASGAGSAPYDTPRKQVLWGNYMAGGGGVEWYFGQYPDLEVEDWTTRSGLWDQTRYALNFFHENLPFHEMRYCNSGSFDILGGDGDYCLGKFDEATNRFTGEIYAVYLDNTGEASLALPASTYQVRDYNPRTGRFEGEPRQRVSSSNGQVVLLGTPSFSGDVAILVTRSATRSSA
ncbi:MAG: hypothetical protein HY582_00890, partial [Candidatus Omnitrophica bacterium]|nr:hypothetical protein [Candidatus Omnitrophota bacterium]